MILTLNHNYPTWSSGATGPDPVGNQAGGAEAAIGHCRRTARGAGSSRTCLRATAPAVPPNPIGPHEPTPGERHHGYDPRAGNPDGASIDALEVCNEPNHLNWPQEGVEKVVAAMIRSAAALSAACGGMRILAPATSDFPDGDDPGNGGFDGT